MVSTLFPTSNTKVWVAVLPDAFLAVTVTVVAPTCPAVVAIVNVLFAPLPPNVKVGVMAALLLLAVKVAPVSPPNVMAIFEIDCPSHTV